MKSKDDVEIGRSGELNTIIGKGTVIQGNLKVNNSLRIDGKVIGDIQSTDTIIVGKDGIVQGQVKGKHVLLAGKVEGNIIVAERVYLESKALIVGDITAPKLVIDEGATFDGKCAMNTAQKNDKGPQTTG